MRVNTLCFCLVNRTYVNVCNRYICRYRINEKDMIKYDKIITEYNCTYQSVMNLIEAPSEHRLINKTMFLHL